MRLVDAYEHPVATALLYSLLEERDEGVNISHREMPNAEQHAAFLRSRPYAHWYLIEADEACVGAIYLTRQDEIGIFILKGQQGHGYGRAAVELLMKVHARPRFLANINPANTRSIGFFQRLGFRHIQNTYELRP